MDGRYSVKSAHRLLFDDPYDAHYSNLEEWKKIWMLNIFHKIRHFIWRTCMDCLPLGRTWGVNLDVSCPFCVDHVENYWHILVHCELASKVWIFCGLPNVIRDWGTNLIPSKIDFSLSLIHCRGMINYFFASYYGIYGDNVIPRFEMERVGCTKKLFMVQGFHWRSVCP